MTKRETFENLLDKGATEYSICDIQEIKGFAYSFSLQLEGKDKEIERLKEELQQEKKDFKETNDYCFELKDYKSRNEKAIEYIKEHTLYSFDLYDKDDVSSYFEKASPKDLLNILKGDDESENKSNK